jgi:adenosylcobinamide-GDP ribazoletransferase
MRLLLRPAQGLASAVAFLTIVPVPAAAFADDAFDLSPATPWFPAVGAAIGAAGGAIRVAFDPVLGRGPSTALAMTAIAVVTGALHHDALADMFDGLGVRGDRARRLAVMRDSAVGAFGVLALVLWALLLFTALDGLSAVHALRALLVACAVGRLAALLHAVLAAPARRDGLGSGLMVTPLALVAATVLAAAIAVAAAGPARAGLALVVAAACAALSAALARHAVGGSTGDTLGATVIAAETLTCLALLATWR